MDDQVCRNLRAELHRYNVVNLEVNTGNVNWILTKLKSDAEGFRKGLQQQLISSGNQRRCIRCDGNPLPRFCPPEGRFEIRLGPVRPVPVRRLDKRIGVVRCPASVRRCTCETSTVCQSGTRTVSELTWVIQVHLPLLCRGVPSPRHLVSKLCEIGPQLLEVLSVHQPCSPFLVPRLTPRSVSVSPRASYPIKDLPVMGWICVIQRTVIQHVVPYLADGRGWHALLQGSVIYIERFRIPFDSRATLADKCKPEQNQVCIFRSNEIDFELRPRVRWHSCPAESVRGGNELLKPVTNDQSEHVLCRTCVHPDRCLISHTRFDPHNLHQSCIQ